MTQPLGNYSPKKVVATVAGIPIDGYADGTFITVEQSEDNFTLYKGAGGDMARAQNLDESGEVTFTLMATSITNAQLSALAKADRDSLTGVGTIIIKDLLGTTLVKGNAAWVKKNPTINFGKEVETREWVFTVAKLKIESQ